MEKQNSEQSNQDMLVQKKGEKFLEELKKKGMSKDRLNQTFVTHLSGQSSEMLNSQKQKSQNTKESDLSQEKDSSLSPSRKLRRLLIDITKEFSVKKDQNT